MARTSLHRPVWMEKPSLATQALKVVAVVIIVVIMLFPFWQIFMVSLSSGHGRISGDLLLWPHNFSLEAYKTVLGGPVVARAMIVSVGITVVGTLASMVFTVLLAYGLTRTREVPGGRALLVFVLMTMLFGAGLIPNYLLVKELGLLNTYASLIVPSLISAFNMVVIRNFFMNIPAELIESARIDGANDFDILVRVVLPLSKAVLAVIALFYGVGYWNAFFNALLYIDSPTKWPIQVVLQQYVMAGQPIGGTPLSAEEVGMVDLPPESLRMAVVMIATIPILLVYPFLQRFFTKGVLTGAIKG